MNVIVGYESLTASGYLIVFALITKDFVEKNLLFLENNLDYVGSISPARFEKYNFNNMSSISSKVSDLHLDVEDVFSANFLLKNLIKKSFNQIYLDVQVL